MPVRCHPGMPCAVARPCVAYQIHVTQMRCSCGVACSRSAIIVWPFPVGGLAAERGVDTVGEPADPTRTARAARTNPHGLTARQLEIAELLREGLIRPQIAARLYISPRPPTTTSAPYWPS